MTLEVVQSRIADIQARIGQLAQTAVTPAATAATATATSPAATAPVAAQGAAFAAQLQSALATAGVDTTTAAAALAAATGTTATTAASATTATGTTASASASATDAVVATATSFLGVPYVWGGTTPRGFDCSGFTQYVYRQQGITLPRTAAAQAKVGRAVSVADAQPGDLVAFDNSRSRAGIDHIGMYLGGGKWIAAPHTGDVVKIQNVDLSRAAAIRRVLPGSGTAATRTAATTAAATASTAATGALPAWAARLPAAARPYVPALIAAGKATGVAPELLAAVAWTESGFSATARSGAGAVGLMQLMPATARGLGVDPSDPAQAALGAARYLKQQLQANGGRTDLALAAYNAGPGAVRTYGGIPPYPETQRYVRTVLDRYTSLGGTST